MYWTLPEGKTLSLDDIVITIEQVNKLEKEVEKLKEEIVILKRRNFLF